MTKDYLDFQIEKSIKLIQDELRRKNIDWNKIRISLYKLSRESFKEGVYCGKNEKPKM